MRLPLQIGTTTLKISVFVDINQVEYKLPTYFNVRYGALGNSLSVLTYK